MSLLDYMPSEMCPVPYVQIATDGKPGSMTWTYAHARGKKLGRSMRTCCNHLMAKYGSLETAVRAGWQFVEEDGTQVSIFKDAGPRYINARTHFDHMVCGLW